MQENSELFSALLDGELAPDEVDALLEALEEDPRKAGTTARWGAIGASMRGQCAATTDILGGVRAAMAEEPLPSRVRRIDSARRRRGLPQRWKLPATGLAAAASLALAVMLLPAAIEQGAPLKPAADATGGAAVAQAEQSQSTVLRSAGSDAPVARPGNLESGSQAREDTLNTYFIEYASHRSAQGIAGPLGYARYAAHNVDISSAQQR